MLASKRERDSLDKHLSALPGVIALLLIIVWYLTGSLLMVTATYMIIIVAIFGTAYYSYRRRRLQFFDSGMKQIDEMSGVMFESLLFEYFKAIGYKGYLTPVEADYGADLVLKKDSIKYVVQAKRWKDDKVGVEAVQQVVGAIGYYSADKALVITSSLFTKNAKQLAKSNNVELWDRNKLITFLSEVKGCELVKKITKKEFKVENDLLCPQCGNGLVLKNGKNGLFVGCTGYPNCRYSQNADL